MQCCTVLVIPRIAVVKIIIIIVLLFPFQEIQESDLEHFANVDMQYLATTMSEECFICSINHCVCNESREES